MRASRTTHGGFVQAASPFLALITAVCLQAATLANGLSAGAAVADITPEPGVSLNGTISKPGLVKGIHDPLHARALVLDDGSMRIALVTLDLTMIERAMCDAIEQEIQRRTGIVPEHVVIAATHTHAAPRVRFGRAGPPDDRYYEWLVRQVALAVDKAVANLAPAEIAAGAFDEPKYTRCRRLLCEPGTVGPNPFGETGELVRSVAGVGGKVIGPAGPVDPEFFVLAIRHRDGTPLAVIGNYSVHYCGGYRTGMVSADYFGYYARRIEELAANDTDHPPPVGIMTNGTSGDTSSIAAGGRRYAPFEWMEISGRLLADRSFQLVGTLRYDPAASLDTLERDLEFKIRRPSDERLAWARDVLDNPNRDYPHRWTRIYAEQTIALSRCAPQRPVKVQAIRIGEVAIATISCEVFAETGLAIKENSPFASTFTISLAGGADGYLPTPQQHAWGGYETWPALSSCLEVDAETSIRQTAIELLRRLEDRRRR